MTRMRWLLLVVSVIALGAIGARAQEAGGPEFADFTAAEAGQATGTLLGAPVALSGPDLSPAGGGSVVDGSSTVFASEAFEPQLVTSDHIQFRAPVGTETTYTLTFGAPVTDPLLHVGSLASRLTFDDADAVTRVSGDERFAVAGKTVEGELLGSTDGNGTIRVEGTFSALSFDAEPTYAAGAPDGILLQVGAVAQAGGPDVAVTKADSADPVAVGDTFTYTLTATNNGPGGINGVGIVDALPEGIELVSLPPGCTEGGTITCSAGELGTGAARSFDLEVRATEAGTFENTAALSATDGEPDNDTATETTTVIAPGPRTLTVERTGDGLGTVTSEPAGIDCGTDCTESFADGTEVALTASPAPGFVFAEFGGACTGADGTTCTLTLGQDRAVTARFEPVPAPSDARLLGRWPLDVRHPGVAGPTTPDASGADLDGADAQAAVVPGRFGNAFANDGDRDGWTVPRAPANEPQGDFSLALWVRTTDPAPTDENAPRPAKPRRYETLVAKHDPLFECAPAYGLTTGDNGSLQFSVRPRTGNPAITPIISTDAVWDGNWHAVTAVYRLEKLTLWVDGRPVSRVPLGSDNEHGAYYRIDDRATLNAGRPGEPCEGEQSALGYSALMDEVRLYDAALTRREIEYLHRPAATTPPHLPEDRGPVNLAPPTLTGTPTPGSTLTCSQGDWTTTGDGEATFLWERAPRAAIDPDDPSWFAIDGALGETYTLVAEDVSSRVRCRVVVADGAGSTAAYSASLRVDEGVPVNQAPPVIEGLRQSPADLTCNPGTWSGGPDPEDFSYQWLRDDEPIAGQTTRTYTTTRTRNGLLILDANADGGKRLACEVIARNDVGVGLPARSASVQPYDNRPAATRAPIITALTGTVTTNPLDLQLSCYTGVWYDDYSSFDPSYPYVIQWRRNGETIAGQTGPTLQVTVDDLGRRITCRVAARNPLGQAPFEDSSNDYIVPLPQGENTTQIFKVGGFNQADPTNLLAVSREYRAEIDKVVVERLTRAVDAFRDDCRRQQDELGVARSPFVAPADNAAVPLVSRVRQLRIRCRIVLYNPPSEVAILPTGVYFSPRKDVTGRELPCALDDILARAFKRLRCPSMQIQLAPIDPLRPPADDAELLARLAPVTPDKVLWDLDRNGRTDAVCPGSAPVLRTIYKSADWNPRAVIIPKDPAKVAAGQFSFGETSFTAVGEPKAARPSLRVGQVRVCATAFDPPPNPQQVPCVTDGQLGRVRITGNLCPVDARDVDPLDYGGFDASLQAALRAQSENRLKGEGTQTQSLRGLDPRYTGPVYPEVDEPADRGFFRRAARQAPGAIDIGATLRNNAAAMSGLRADDLASVNTPLKKALGLIDGFDVPKANFIFNQVYASIGTPLMINGVALDPSDGTAGLIVPTEAKEALKSVKSIQVYARDAKTVLGDPRKGIPMAAKNETVKAALAETARTGTAQANELLRQANLDDVVKNLKDAADNLDLGPFKLRGTAEVKINDDNTATLKASAVLPGLTLVPGVKSSEARADVTLKGDLDGNVTIEGLRLKPPGVAYLGGVKIKDLDITYLNGLDLKGEIVFPAPVNGAIRINQFKMGPDGEFQVLDVAYLAGPGGGINVGTGVFITRLAAALNLLTDELGGGTTISVGPAAGDGCPTVGVAADFKVHFAPLYSAQATGDVQIVCISLVQLKFKADGTGLVSLEGRVDKSLGPIYFEGGIGAAIRLPDWQATYDGGGGIKTPIGNVGLDFELALSNIGLAGCAALDLLILKPAAGAAVRFVDGIPPLNPVSMISNLRFFLGCDISEYRPVTGRRNAAIAQAGGTTFTVPAGTGGSVFSIEGAGAAPRVRLRSPSGQVLDYTAATGEGGTKIGETLGTVVETEDRTVVFMTRPAAGNWTAEVAPGSAPIVRVLRADLLPKPEVKGRVTGKGTKRTLTYRIKRIPGQEVRFVEAVNGGRQVLRTVRGGGRGKLRFRVTEAEGTRRRIRAEVSQDELPRADMTLARFTAPNPRVGKPRRVRVRRAGRRAVVTWARAPFSSAHEVSVRTGSGRRFLVTPARRRVVVRRLGAREGVVVRVVAFSPAGRPGKAVTAKLRGNMRVGANRPAKRRPSRQLGTGKHKREDRKPGKRRKRKRG